MMRWFRALVRRLPLSWGRRRVVLVLPAFGIVLKFPRVRPQEISKFLDEVDVLGLEMWGNPDPETKVLFWESVGESLVRHWRKSIGGVVDNWNERAFYKKSSTSFRPLLQPTFLSFMGLVNIQRFGCPCTAEDDESLYHSFYAISDQILIRDGHHFGKANNFHLAPEGLTILDYASSDTQEVVKEFGPRLRTEFDIEKGRATKAHFARVIFGRC